MTKYLRFVLAWTLFGAGHLLSVIMSGCDVALLYPLYNKLMIWSCHVQGTAALGPWEKRYD